MVMSRTSAVQMRTQAVSPLSRAAVGILPPVAADSADAGCNPRTILSVFGDAPIGRKSRRRGTYNLVGNGAKWDNIVRLKNGRSTAARIRSRPPGCTRMSEGRRASGPVRTKMYLLDIRHTFSQPRLCPAGLAANSRSVAVAASTEARTDLRSLSVLSEIGKSLASVPGLRGSLERVLEEPEEHRGIVRGAVFLLDASTSDLGVEAAVGIPAEGLRARYKV